jgi:GNAT superfamily N-acetyltransferase
MRYILEKCNFLIEKKSINITIGAVDMDLALKTWVSIHGIPASFYAVSKWVDESISKSIYVDGVAVGVYLLGTTGISEIMDYFSRAPIKQTPLEDLSKYDNKKALHGIHLAVLPEYKGKGLGKKLIKYSESIDFEYIWGTHHVFLNNREHWEKRRRVVVEIKGNVRENDGFYTLKDLK